MIERLLKYLGILLFIYILLGVITPFNSILRTRSISNQIQYLSKELDNGYDEILQSRFPEGKIFSNAILALATIEYSKKVNIDQKTYAKIVDNCINRIHSDRATSKFDSLLNPKYGMFYNGWANYVYSNYVNSNLFNYSQIGELVNSESALIESRIISTLEDSLRMLESYKSAAWPADNMIGLLSIDKKKVQSNWLNFMLNSTKHKSGLIHHASNDGTIIRGSSSAMITFLLSKLQPKLASDYNDAYKEIFVNEYLGIQLVKENEDGSSYTDYDSGPIIFGYGASATIMNIKTQASFKCKKAKLTWGVMNTISMPIYFNSEKYYLLKREPMFDLFMLWASTEF